VQEQKLMTAVKSRAVKSGADFILFEVFEEMREKFQTRFEIFLLRTPLHEVLKFCRMG